MAAVRSPEWWRDRLLKRYRDDLTERLIWDRLYDSRQPMADPLPRYQAAYRRLMSMSRTPWSRLVVDIVTERLNLAGVRLSVPGFDEVIWGVLRDSKLLSIQNNVHREAINLGTSYLSVWRQDTLPILAWESALTVTHELEPGDTHRVAGAIKVWEDTIDGLIRVNVYLPDGTYKWTAKATHTPESSLDTTLRLDSLIARTGWTWTDIDVVDNPYGIVPMIPFTIRPNWDGYGQSDLDDLRPVLDRIENLTANIMLAVELGAFRQRWATGLEVPRDPETDQPIEPFKVALDRLWVSEDENTKFGSFEATDISGYLKAVSDAVGQLSAVSRIPVTYFVQSELANPPSAASLEASETGLINKVMERQENLGEAWEEVVRLVIQMTADAPSELDLAQVGVLWKDARTRSESQVLDAATKLGAIGAPFDFVMEFIGYSPTEIERMREARMRDTFERLLATPIQPATAPVGGGGQPPPEAPAQLPA